MNRLYFSLILLIFTACGNVESNSLLTTSNDSLVHSEPVVIDTLPLFEQISSSFGTDSLVLPEGFTYQVIFSEKDMVTRADGQEFPAKGNHDLTIFIPDETNPNTKGWLYISHETKYKDDGLGDGGGATMFEVELDSGKWKVLGNYEHVDFSGVGYTNRNCGGSLTPKWYYFYM